MSGTTPLEDNERMLVACLQVLAMQAAEGPNGVDMLQGCLNELKRALARLGGVSPMYAIETAVYLRGEVRRIRSGAVD